MSAAGCSPLKAESCLAGTGELSRSLLRVDRPADLSTDAPESAQIPVTAMDLSERMGHEQAQDIPPVGSGTNLSSAAMPQRLANG